MVGLALGKEESREVRRLQRLGCLPLQMGIGVYFNPLERIREVARPRPAKDITAPYVTL